MTKEKALFRANAQDQDGKKNHPWFQLFEKWTLERKNLAKDKFHIESCIKEAVELYHTLRFAPAATEINFNE